MMGFNERRAVAVVISVVLPVHKTQTPAPMNAPSTTSQGKGRILLAMIVLISIEQLPEKSEHRHSKTNHNNDANDLRCPNQ